MSRIKIQYLDGFRLRRAIIAGAEWVIQKQVHLDDINVFPVPDGDTGTNMASTMKSVRERLGVLFAPSVAHIGEVVADSALMGARGNSGAILAQFFQGMADGLKGHIRISTEGFAKAVVRGAEWSREAIADPKEGTILTVIQDWAESVRDHAPNVRDFSDLIATTILRAKQTLRETPEKLAVLKKAGVVDAGAQGFVYLLEGIQAFMDVGKIDRKFEADVVDAFGQKAWVDHGTEEITFRFCTECLLEGADLDLATIRGELEVMGDSLIVAGSRQKMRAHIHTNSPQEVFETLERYGVLTQQKADDMIQQHTDAFAEDLASVGLIVDSGCDLPADVIREHNIHVVPLQLLFGTRAYIDGVTIDSEKFYQLLLTDEHHPKSSQPTPADFDRVYAHVMKHYESAVSLHVPDLLSGTMQSARRAAKKYGERIQLIDCKSVSIGMALVTLTAARAVREGKDPQGVAQVVEDDISRLRTYISLPTMDFLVKGGRVSKTRGLLGKMLKIRPVLTFNEEGTLDLAGKAIRNQSVHELTLQLIKEEIGDRKGLRMAIGHAHAPEIAAWYEEKIRNLFEPRELMVQEISPVLAVHGGPGVAGVSFIL